MIHKEIKNIDIEYPKRLLKISNSPEKLYCIGNNKLLNSSKIVAIVGSRNCTEYGRKYARAFSEELSKNGICIISGLAIGIDAAAHAGAIYEQGKTIAVLGGGLNHIYPKENEWLYNLIISKGGLIITEYGDEEKTKLSNFPKRNRIISGIADAVLVVEATAIRSGSIITARFAKSQGKKVFCIPSNIDSSRGIGTNKLIMEGASLVTEPIQIIKALYKIENKEELEKPIQEIPEEYKEIYRTLISTELTVDEIARKLNKDINQINYLLTMMELEGLVIHKPGNIFKLKE